jgi:hypothetical protein
MDRRARADALLRATLSLGDSTLRAKYVAAMAGAWSTEALAQALDVLCERAEQAETPAREALVAIVEALNGEGMEGVVARLRDQAVTDSLLALERLIRHPSRAARSVPPQGEGARSRSTRPPPDLTRSWSWGALSASAPAAPGGEGGKTGGRALTLGDRKWLACRPDRETMQRLLADPHPDVIRRCLGNPRVTEDDVIRVAARRPGRGEILVEVARSPWARRPRVRLALVLNPATPVEIALRLAGLLLRPELDLVARSPAVNAPVRALCLEHLQRRPPIHADTSDDELH